MPKPFKGTINLDIRDSTQDWSAYLSTRAPEGSPNVLVVHHHCTDVVPTILDCCGVEMPAVVDGHEQTPLPGVSMRYSFDAADTPTRKETTVAMPESGRYTYFPGTSEIPEASAANTTNVSHKILAEDEFRTVASRYSLCGEGLYIGYDGGDAVSSEYTPAFEFTGGSIAKVVFDVADDAYVDVEAELAAALARD